VAGHFALSIVVSLHAVHFTARKVCTAARPENGTPGVAYGFLGAKHLLHFLRVQASPRCENLSPLPAHPGQAPLAQHTGATMKLIALALLALLADRGEGALVGALAVQGLL
jgi:hypothetical protein